LLSSGMG